MVAIIISGSLEMGTHTSVDKPYSGEIYNRKNHKVTGVKNVVLSILGTQVFCFTGLENGIQ